MVVVGAYARVETAAAVEVRARLAAVGGVSTFDLDEPGKVGLLIEAASVAAAHARLCGELAEVPGVLGVWPVFVGAETEADAETPAAEEA